MYIHLYIHMYIWPIRELVGKGQTGSAQIGVTANFMFFDRDFFGVLPLTYFYPQLIFVHTHQLSRIQYTLF